MNEMIGIVVTVYNKNRYLTKCLDSICGQTYRNLQVVIVDDGSTDGSAEICDKYASIDKRIRVIHQKNAGEIAALRAGVQALNTNYVTFVDADDWIANETYEMIADCLKDNIDLVTFCIVRYFDDKYQYITNNSFPSGYYDKSSIKELFPSVIWNENKNNYGMDPSLCNKVFKKNMILEELNKLQGVRLGYGKDVAISFSIISKVNSLWIMDEALYYHRQREPGEKPQYISSELYYRDLLSIYEYLLNNLPRNPLLQKQLDYYFAHEVNRKKAIYNSDRIKGRYRQMFPFKKVEQNKKIVLYGANEVGQEFFEQIQRTEYGEVVLWVDGRYKEYSEKGVASPEKISGIEFDYVVIASDRMEVVESIKEELLQRNISENKIVLL